MLYRRIDNLVEHINQALRYFAGMPEKAEQRFELFKLKRYVETHLCIDCPVSITTKGIDEVVVERTGVPKKDRKIAAAINYLFEYTGEITGILPDPDRDDIEASCWRLYCNGNPRSWQRDLRDLIGSLK